jgi:hypothetical protein
MVWYILLSLKTTQCLWFQVSGVSIRGQLSDDRRQMKNCKMNRPFCPLFSVIRLLTPDT